MEFHLVAYFGGKGDVAAVAVTWANGKCGGREAVEDLAVTVGKGK